MNQWIDEWIILWLDNEQNHREKSKSTHQPFYGKITTDHTESTNQQVNHRLWKQRRIKRIHKPTHQPLAEATTDQNQPTKSKTHEPLTLKSTTINQPINQSIKQIKPIKPTNTHTPNVRHWLLAHRKNLTLDPRPRERFRAGPERGNHRRHIFT